MGIFSLSTPVLSSFAGHRDGYKKSNNTIGKPALMFLKPYTGFSDRELVESINGNMYNEERNHSIKQVGIRVFLLAAGLPAGEIRI